MSEYDYTEVIDPEEARRLDAVARQEEWEADDTRVVPRLPRKAHRATRTEWARYKRRHAHSLCQAGCGELATDLHHLLPRDGAGSWPSGDDFLRNLAPLCRHCHALIEARDMPTRARLGERLTEQQLGYLYYRIGPRMGAFLQRHYSEAA